MQEELKQKTIMVLKVGRKCAEHIWTEDGMLKRKNWDCEEAIDIAIAGRINGRNFYVDTTEVSKEAVELSYLPGTKTIYCRVNEEEYASNLEGDDGMLQFVMYAVGEQTEFLSCFSTKEGDLPTTGIRIGRDHRKALRLWNIFRVISSEYQER